MEALVTPGYRIWRIRRHGEFERLRNQGRRGRHGPVTVTFLPTDDTLPPRVAFAIGKRVGSAVERNRVRRRLRALAQAGSLSLPGWYLISVTPNAVSVDQHTLGDHLRSAAQTAVRRSR